MEIRASDATGDVSHVTLSGRMDPHGSSSVRDQLRAETVGRDRPAVVDLSAVTFITSVGIGILVDCSQTLRRAGHAVVFVKACGQVDDVFRKTGIYTIVSAVDTVEEAFAAITDGND
jgi:anti-anti-sigma factor